jgi:hypothetical protein
MAEDLFTLVAFWTEVVYCPGPGRASLLASDVNLIWPDPKTPFFELTFELISFAMDLA